MKESTKIKIREKLFDLHKQLSEGRNPEFLAYDFGVRGDDRDEIIDGLVRLGCIEVKQKIGQTKAEIIADFETIENAIKLGSYDKL